MKYTFKGRLCGYLCDDCSEWLSNVEVLLYLPWQKDRVLATTVANPKETFHIVSADEAAQRKDLLIARTTTDEAGNFEFSVDEKHQGSAFDLDFICGTVPHTVPLPPHRKPVQIHTTTVLPQWRGNRDQESFFYLWEYCVDAKWWCYIRGHFFDAWAICGHLRNCDTGAPIANAQVTAWDADFLSDDNLGTGTTNANGHFRIDYASIQFKQTFLSPLINLETEPGTLLSHQFGPDVYFKAELSGISLVSETKADRRNNVGYCLCVDLCSKVHVDNPGTSFPSAWTGIGAAFSASFGVHSYDFDAEGYAGSGKYALSGVIRLTGQAPATTASGNHVEYRFLVSETTTPNGGPSPALSSFTRIVGVGPALENMFVPSVVAKLTKKIPDGINDDLLVSSDQADFDAQGWFDVNKSITRALAGALPTPANLSDYWIIDEDTLISLNTAVIAKPHDVPSAAAAVGSPVPAADKIPIQKMAVRFEIRDATTAASIPGSGKTLNAMIINNSNMFMKLSIAELEATGLCNPIGGTVHAKYTVYHPHLASSSMHLNNNSHTVERDISDPPFLTLGGNTNPAVDGGANSSLQINNPPNDMTKCTYSLKLYARARLHNGDGAWSDSGPLEQLFFYNA